MDLTKLADSFKKRESSEHLRLLAKRAAGMYISKQSDNLTSAVSESIKGENLNKDQMRRVAEMANQSAWKEMFDQDRQVNFEPANHSDIISNFSEKPEESSSPSLDYKLDPPAQKGPDIDLEKEFGLTSSEEYPSVNPDADKQEEVSKAAAALDATRHAVNLMKSTMPEVADDFFRKVQHAHLFEGHSLSKIAKAVSSVTDVNFASSIMKTAAEHLVSEGVRVNLDHERDSIKQDLIVNTDHDLMRTAAKLEKIAKALAHANATHFRTKERYRRALETLRGE